MTDDLVFYTNPMSRGRIVRWMLEEIGRPYRTELLEYGTTMKAPEYLAINPMGKVPTLLHGETIITENAAICAYLADAFPEAGLAPRPGDRRRGPYYRWLFFAAGPLEAAVTNQSFGFELPDDRSRGMAGYGSLALVVLTLETLLSGRDYVLGDRFSAADVYLGSHIGWGMEFGTIERRAGIRALLGAAEPASGPCSRHGNRRRPDARAAAGRDAGLIDTTDRRRHIWRTEREMFEDGVGSAVQIRSRRFVLRDFVNADRAAFIAYQSEARYRALYDAGDGHHRRANALFDRFLAWQEEHPRRHFQLGIFESGTGRSYGSAGLREVDRAERTAVLGIELNPDVWGRYRLAIEVAGVLLHHAFSELDLHLVTGSTASGNRRVEKLARWSGADIIARREGPAWMTSRGWHEVEWALSRDAWTKAERTTRRAAIMADGHGRSRSIGAGGARE